MNLHNLKQKLMENIVDQTESTSNILDIAAIRVFDYLQVAATENQFGRGSENIGVGGGKASANMGKVGANNPDQVGTGNYKANKNYTYQTMNYIMTDRGFDMMTAGNDKRYFIVPRIPLKFQGDYQQSMSYLMSAPNFDKVSKKTLKFKPDASLTTVVSSADLARKARFDIFSLYSAYLSGKSYLISVDDQPFKLKDNLINTTEIYMDARFDNETNAQRAKKILDKIFSTDKIGEQEHNAELEVQLKQFKKNVDPEGNTFLSESELDDYQELFKWAVSINQGKVDKTLDVILKNGAKFIKVDKKLQPMGDAKAQAVVYSPGSYSLNTGFSERLEKTNAGQFGGNTPGEVETVFVGWIDNYDGEAGKQYKNTPIAYYFPTKSDSVRKFFSNPNNQVKRITITAEESESIKAEFERINTSGTLKTVDGIAMVQLPKEIYEKAFTPLVKKEVPVKEEAPKPVAPKPAPVKAAPKPVQAPAPVAAPVEEPVKPAEAPQEAPKSEPAAEQPQAAPASAPVPKPDTKAQKLYSLANRYIAAKEDLPVKIFDDLIDAIKNPAKKDLIKNDINKKLEKAKLSKVGMSHAFDIDRLMEVGRLSSAALDKGGAIREFLANGNELTPHQYDTIVSKGIDKNQLDALVEKYKKLNMMEGVMTASLDALFKSAGMGDIPKDVVDLRAPKAGKTHNIKKLLENARNKPVW